MKPAESAENRSLHRWSDAGRGRKVGRFHPPVVSVLAAAVFLAVAGPAQAEPHTMQNAGDFKAEAAARFAQLALKCVHTEYPNKIWHVMQGDADAQPPRVLTPAFYGCFDWHSSVHGHWLLARLAHLYPDAEFSPAARAALGKSLTAQNIEGEVQYLRGPGRVSFERPYGLAWLLQLAAELRSWDDPDARTWSAAIEPLEQVAAQNVATWLPKLRYPIRSGEHSQTAFAFGLIHDWAMTSGNEAMRALIDAKAREFYLVDINCPLAYEPSGQDFLSPCLAEADLMRRVLKPADYAIWLQDFMPMLPRDGSTAWLKPAEVTDRADPKLAHLDGLNLSRAWMLRGIALGLPAGDPRRDSLLNASREHGDEALPAVTGEHYEGGHWLGTFAVYLVTRAGAGGS
jgi:hypothetical protein